MSRITRFIGWLTVILVFCGLVVASVELPKMLPQSEVKLARYEAQQAHADLQRVQVELDLTQAQADLTRAEGEKAVLESAARSIDSDRQLTEYYAHRADTRAILFMVSVLGLFMCGVGIVYVAKGVQDGQTKNTNTK